MKDTRDSKQHGASNHAAMSPLQTMRTQYRDNVSNSERESITTDSTHKISVNEEAPLPVKQFLHA
jgi:hypothetical protein